MTTSPDPSSTIPMTSIIPPPIQANSAPAPISAVPPHLQAHYRGVTPPTLPPTHTPTPPYGYSAAPPLNGTYNNYPPGYTAGTTGASLPASQPGITPGLSEALAIIPPEQKVGHCSLCLAIGDNSNDFRIQALILRVITMTPEQIKVLPATERATYIQIVRPSLSTPYYLYHSCALHSERHLAYRRNETTFNDCTTPSLSKILSS